MAVAVSFACVTIFVNGSLGKEAVTNVVDLVCGARSWEQTMYTVATVAIWFVYKNTSIIYIYWIQGLFIANMLICSSKKECFHVCHVEAQKRERKQ